MTRSPRYLALFAALVSIFFSLAFTRPARADAAATALFQDAKKLMQAGKFADACPKLEESQRLDPAIGTQFNLAFCYESLGKMASAWSLYLDVAGLAKSTNQPEREKAARQSAAAIEGKLSRLTITVDPKVPPNVEVKRDGVPIGRAQWGTGIPVDPGPHQVMASAPGKKTWETTVKIEPGEAEKTVTVPELAPGPPPPAGYGPYPPPPQAPPKPRTKRRSGGMMAGGIIALSVGTVTGLVGLVLVGNDNSRGAGVGITVGSLLLIGGGIGLTVVGAKKIPLEEPAPAAAPKAATLVPDVTIAPGAASLHWAF